MSSIDEQKGANAPEGSDVPPANGHAPELTEKVDDPYGADEDGYPHEHTEAVVAAPISVETPPAGVPAPVTKPSGNGGGKTPPPTPPSDDGDDDEEGMLRMSF